MRHIYRALEQKLQLTIVPAHDAAVQDTLGYYPARPCPRPAD
ncbi:MAG: hypothetical protein AAAB16_23505 [Pseudomonas sp.]